MPVFPRDQNLDRQLSMLKEYGCGKIIEEKFTGTVKDRQGLQTLMNVIRANDIVVVESISRLGRKTIDIQSIMLQKIWFLVTVISRFIREVFQFKLPLT